jgi:Icc-related predicted phosphoesterase
MVQIEFYTFDLKEHGIFSSFTNRLIMRIVAISDTHNLHHRLKIPTGDVLLHAGDVSIKGTEEEVHDFLNWFAAQPHPYKVFIAGNHDYYFEEKSSAEIQAILPEGVHYLNEESIEINGLKIWGSPITPIPRRRWAFNKIRGEEIQQHWDLIPEDVDILMVHGPPKNILDTILDGSTVGCENLRQTIHRKKPKIMLCGHIHENRGQRQVNDTLFINASSVDRHRTRVFSPFVFDL